MKRNLIALTAVVLALGTNVVLAQDQFEDPYWKQLNGVHAVEPISLGSTGESRADFSFVDKYAPN